MITSKKTAAWMAAMSLLGTVAPAAFAQVGNINEDDDIFAQANAAFEAQGAFSAAGTSYAGNQAGVNVVSANVQDADIDQHNNTNDIHDVEQVGVDVYALFLLQHIFADEGKT
ncbi:MAG TPA: hypothetical protein VGE97_03640 [Nitrososphaera sp.]